MQQSAPAVQHDWVMQLLWKGQIQAKSSHSSVTGIQSAAVLVYNTDVRQLHPNVLRICWIGKIKYACLVHPVVAKEPVNTSISCNATAFSLSWQLGIKTLPVIRVDLTTLNKV